MGSAIVGGRGHLEDRADVVVLALVSNFARWIHRRVECVTFLDDVTIRRDVSVDFTVPGDSAAYGPTEELPWIPLTFLQKELLRGFDLRDGHGQPVPMLTRSENSHHAGGSLVAAAREVLTDRLQIPMVPSSIKDVLIEVAGADSAEAESARRAWQEMSAKPGKDQAAWTELVADEGFDALAQALARNFILFAVTPPKPGKRQIMKFSYEERFDDALPFDVLGRLHLVLAQDGWRDKWRAAVNRPPNKMEQPDAVAEDPGAEGWKRRAAITLGWHVKTVSLTMPAANLASSFHVEVPAPPDMEIDSALLRFKPRNGAVAEGTDSDTADGILLQRAHLYASEVTADLEGEALVHLRARRQGFLRSAVATAWLTVVFLWTGYGFFADLTKSANSQTAAALLLIVTTLLSGALIRPSEHRLVARVLVGVRGLLAIGMFCTFLAVGVLAGVGGGARRGLWLAAAIIATVSAVLLAASYVLPQHLYVDREA